MLCSVRLCVCMPLGSIRQCLVIKSIHLALSFFRLYHRNIFISFPLHVQVDVDPVEKESLHIFLAIQEE